MYATFFAGAIGLAFSALARHPTDWRLLGATAGVIAFLGTCLTGHPLLVQEVAAAFFVQLALAASLGGSALLNAPSARSVRLQPDGARPPKGGRYVRIGTVLGTTVFAVLPAWTLEKPMVPVHLEEVDGMYYGDEGTADGVPFHWTRQFSSIFVPATARTIDVPLRSPLAALTKQPTLVEIRSGGTTLLNTEVDDKWTTVRLTLPSPEPPLQVSRISLRTNRTATVAQLVPGSHDQRVVGLQVGDFQIVLVAWEFVPLRKQD